MRDPATTSGHSGAAETIWSFPAIRGAQLNRCPLPHHAGVSVGSVKNWTSLPRIPEIEVDSTTIDVEQGVLAIDPDRGIQVYEGLLCLSPGVASGAAVGMCTGQ